MSTTAREDQKNRQDQTSNAGFQIYWGRTFLALAGLCALLGGIGTAIVASLGTLSWLTMTRAFFLVDASVVVPFEFLRLPFAALVAYLWFAEVPSVWTWLGGAVIFGATAYIAEREARARVQPSSSRGDADRLPTS